MEDTEKQTYTVYDIMKILGIGRNSAYNLVAKKEFSVVKVGRTLRISKRNKKNTKQKKVIKQKGNLSVSQESNHVA